MNDNVTQLISRSSGVYVLPSVYSEFNRKLQEPNTTNNQLADIIQFDAGLTAFLLKLVNSAFYGFPSRISSISHAISIIGRKELATLVLGKSVIDVFSKINVKSKVLNAHWEQSLACALFARQIAKMNKVSDDLPESFFVAGLIHGIGKLVIWDAYPQLAESHVNANSFEDYLAAEQDLLGFNYTHVGASLVEKWKLPELLIKTTRFHHDAGVANDDAAVSLVALSSQMAFSQSHHPDAPVSPALLTTLCIRLDSNEADTKEWLAQCHQQLQEMKSTFIV